MKTKLCVLAASVAPLRTGAMRRYLTFYLVFFYLGALALSFARLNAAAQTTPPAPTLGPGAFGPSPTSPPPSGGKTSSTSDMEDSEGARLLLGDLVARFERRFEDTTFGTAISLGSRGDIQTGISGKVLEVRVDHNATKLGEYQKYNRRPFGGLGSLRLRNNLFILQSFTPGDFESETTIWHEFMHHLIHLKGGAECGPEEAYTQLLEDRVTWLRRLQRSFDAAYRDNKPTAELKQRWKGLEEAWKTGGQLGGSLSGSYTWADPDNSCEGGGGKRYTIDEAFIHKLDAQLSINVNITKIRKVYSRLDAVDTGAAPPELVPPWERLPGALGSPTVQRNIDAEQPSSPASSYPHKMTVTVNGYSSTVDLESGKVTSSAGAPHGTDVEIKGVGTFRSVSVSVTVDRALPRGWSISAGTCCSIAIPICKSETGATECNGTIEVPEDWAGVNVLGSITKADQDGRPTGANHAGIILYKK